MSFPNCGRSSAEPKLTILRTANCVELIAVLGLPLIEPGVDLAREIVGALANQRLDLQSGDVLVIAQKAVSKAEGRFVDLHAVVPSQRAVELAAEIRKDARLVEVILSQSSRVVRKAANVLIVEHVLGFVMANAGVDQSNVGPGPAGPRILLLPADPDRSAMCLRDQIISAVGAQVAVIINDSFGRPWRNGSVGVAIGAAGLPTLSDRRGKPDLFGRPLEVTVVGWADEIAAAASLVMGQGDEGCPVVLVRGLDWRDEPAGTAAALRRPVHEDLFR